MLLLGLLAILVVGIGLPLSPVASTGRAGRRERSDLRLENYSAVTPGAENVAVLIAAHNREDRIVAALNSAVRIVSLSNIYLVSDDSTDRTVELARDYGVRVVETFGRPGWAGAIESGIQAFRLLDEFKFVLLVDVDTRLDPRHLDRVLPMFDDGSVAAVDVRVDAEWRTYGRTPLASVLTAYRARSYALASRRGRARVLPSVARTYRSTSLRGLELNPPGIAVADFDLTQQLYRGGLGRVALCPDVLAHTAGPNRFADYRRQHALWCIGFWQALRRNGIHSLGRAGAVTELLVTSLLFALAPLVVLLAIPGLRPPAPLSAPAIAATIILADYLITLAVAVARREPRYLLPGLLFPVLRVLDAVSVLAALTRGRAGEPSQEWLAFGEPAREIEPEAAEVPDRAAAPANRRNPLLAAFAWVLCAGAAAVAVVRVALTTATLPPLSTETALVDASYGTRAALGGPLALTDLQLRTYTTVTSAFGRQPSLLQAARELSVICAAVIVLGMLVVAAILRVHPLIAAVAVGMLAASGPAVALLTPVGPGVTAAAWLAVAMIAVVAAIGWRDHRWITGGAIALLGALLTAPILIIPIGAGVAGWFAGRSRRLAVAALGALALTGAAAFGLWRAGLLLSGESPLEHDQRVVVLGVVGAAAAAGLIVTWLRPVAVGIGAGAGFVAAVGAEADTLLPALVLASALLVAVLIEEAAGTLPEGGPAVATRAGGAIAAAVAITGGIAGALLAPRSWTPPDHAAVAGWAVQNLAGEVRLIAPPELRSDLDRDLTRAGRTNATLPAGSLAAQGELLIAVGQDRPGIQLASFGPVAVLLPNSGDGYLELGTRLGAGMQLATNPRLHAGPDVLAAIRGGRLDLRAMALVAALCREHDITIAETGNPAHELGAPQPDRMLILSEVDGQPVTDDPRAAPLMTWLRAQEPPYAPADVRVTPAGVRVGWRLPARLDLPPS